MKINSVPYKIGRTILGLVIIQFMYHVLIAFLMAVVSFVSYDNIFLYHVSQWHETFRFIYILFFIFCFGFALAGCADDTKDQ